MLAWLARYFTSKRWALYVVRSMVRDGVWGRDDTASRVNFHLADFGKVQTHLYIHADYVVVPFSIFLESRKHKICCQMMPNEVVTQGSNTGPNINTRYLTSI